MNGQNRAVDIRGLCYFAASVAAGVAAAHWCQPLVHDNKDARDVIVTLFSILAGFLVAIMTIVGDPATYKTRAWREHQLIKRTIFARLARQKWLFYGYLLTLGLLFSSVLAGKKFPSVTVWTEYAYVGLATTAFLLSLRLPSILMKIQMDRHDQVIGEKRDLGGIDGELPRNGD